MSITTTTLTRGASTAAVAAGLIFVGVQIGHPHLDAETVTTTDVAVRTFLKLLMVSFALVGITGMYLRQVTQAGVLGLVGYLVYSAGYLLILSTTSLAVYVLPEVTGSRPEYVDDVLAAATGGSAGGDIGLLATVFQLQGFAYLAGGLVFGIALFRARVLSRWASVLLAVSGLVSALLTVMPDAFYRLLAFPNGIAMVALGISLWRSVGTGAADIVDASATAATATAGAR